jgi:hypothetical protein
MFGVQGCRALRNLCVLNDASLEQAIAKGACGVLMNCIRWHLEKGFVSGVTLSESAQAVNKQSQAGLFGGLIGSIFSRGKSASSVPAAPSLDVAPQQSKLIADDGEEAVVRGVVQWAWFAVAGIAEVPSSLNIFRENNGLQLCKRTLSRYGQHEDVAQWACHALCKLAEAPECASCLGQSTSDVFIVNELIQILSCHVASEDVLEECISALGMIAGYEENNLVIATLNLESQDDNADVYCPLFRALSKHHQNETVTEVTLFLLAKLCQPKVDKQLLVVDKSGLAKLVPQQLLKYASNPAIALSGSTILSCLCSQDDIANKLLNSYHAIAAIVAVCMQHYVDSGVVDQCLDALITMTRLCDSSVLVRLRAENVCVCMFHVLWANMETNSLIAKKALAFIAALADDDVCRGQFAAYSLQVGPQRQASIAEIVIQCLMLNEGDRDAAVLGFNAITVLCGGVLTLEQATLPQSRAEFYDSSPQGRQGMLAAVASPVSPGQSSSSSNSSTFFSFTKKAHEGRNSDLYELRTACVLQCRLVCLKANIYNCIRRIWAC